ncbi:MAG TPA: IS200/IS605 family transposase [Blastocatellia bacterium]|nr:IS200/IS605 family transposase [Blastocatellia bacterium]
MQIDPLSDLSWAYQLHHYICFRTHRLRRLFDNSSKQQDMSRALAAICSNHAYHLMKSRTYPDHVRMLISLRPQHATSKVVQTLKSNSATEFGCARSITRPLWGRGYLAISVGKVRIGTVREYLRRQAEHHRYDQRARPPVFRYRSERLVPLTAAHCRFDLNYHLVFSTETRKGIFGSSDGEALTQYWLRVAAKHNFALDGLTILPDHVHLMVRTTPAASIEQCALKLLNNAQYFVATRWPQGLIRAGLHRVWQPSAYAGTCGNVTTAIVKAYLGGP